MDENRRLALLFAALASLIALPAAGAELSENMLVRVAVHRTVVPESEFKLPVEPAASAPELEDDYPPVSKVDLTAECDDLWERVRNGFAMPDLDSDLVAKHQAYYLNHPQYLERITERSRRYLYYIVEELEKRGMPTELALLPMVESAFNPMAYSRARASGLWQFIPSTGRDFQLKQDWWIDQRRDIVASTNAALDYLQAVYQMHGDWHLALASYNWGEGAVAHAIERNRAKGLPTDYMSLRMPAETRNYVPKLQALKNIIARPQAFDASLAPIPNRPYFATVDKPADMDIALAAKLAEMPVNEFMALNSGFNRPVVTGQARLALPADKVETFLANLESHDKPLVSWSSYTLKPHERLDKVAARFGLTAAKLRHINGLSHRTKVAGRTLLVPKGGALVAAEPVLASLPETPGGSDTRSSLRARHGKGKTMVVRGKHGKKIVVAAKSRLRASGTHRANSIKRAVHKVVRAKKLDAERKLATSRNGSRS